MARGVDDQDRRFGRFAYRARNGPARTLRFEYAELVDRPGCVGRGRPARRRRGRRSRRSSGGCATVRRSAARHAARRADPDGRQARDAPGADPGRLAHLRHCARARTDGRWTYRYTFTQTSATARYTFRVPCRRRRRSRTSPASPRYARRRRSPGITRRGLRQSGRPRCASSGACGSRFASALAPG